LIGPTPEFIDSKDCDSKDIGVSTDNGNGQSPTPNETSYIPSRQALDETQS